MSEYFGKKGISLHVDVFFTKNEDGTIKKHVYHAISDVTNQDAGDTLAVFDVVLKQFKLDNPEINSLHIRSDNAGAYKCNGVMEALFKIAQNYDIKIERYDFSEAQDGKDQPDREGAALKEFAHSYIAADRTHKITNAMELKKGIMFRGGPKRCKVAVLTMDPNSKFVNKGTLKNITKYHSFHFGENGYKVWRYYNIGEGKVVNFANTSFEHDTKIDSNFDEWVRDQEMMPRRSQPTFNNLWYCNEECFESFQSEEELLAHKMSGEHSKITPKSSKDAILNIYRDLASGSVNEMRPLAPVPGQNSSVSQNSCFFKRGWALPVRAGGRLDKDAKEFCLIKFAEGQQNGKKYSPEKISKLMRDEIDPLTNELKFNSQTLLTTKQIDSLLSRYANLVKKMKITNEDVQQNVEEIVQIMPTVNSFIHTKYL